LRASAQALRALPLDASTQSAAAMLAEAVKAYANDVVAATVADLNAGRWHAVAATITLSNRRYVDLKGQIDALAQKAHEQARADVASSAQLARRGLIATGGLILLSCTGFGVWTWINVRRIRCSAHAAQTIAQRLAQLDLRPVDVPRGGDEIVTLCRQLNAALEALTRAFADARQTARSVDTAARELASSGSELSARTESQAASLQQTAAATDQLISTVANNDAAARQARGVADTAAGLASDSGRAMAQAVEMMQRIGSVSGRIAEISRVIDGIAFQTNILALNAAVEAARAGEHGRGFAVVASEVRALASRSAAAAREITQLITESSQTVQEGVDQVASTNELLGRLVEQVASLHTLLEGIVTASAEQAAGIAEMNKAVQLLDGNTQQNAALVEQTAATASMLQSEADKLVKTLSSFKLAAA